MVQQLIMSGSPSDACELTLDPNTAYRRLSLSEDNRKVTWVGEDQSYPDHPDRIPDHSLLSSSYHQPRIHPYINRKATMWSLPIRKSINIMGDSNSARIPKVRPDTKLIVLSVGINNPH